jgi:hypothetical protein
MTRVTLKAVNDELARMGHTARLAKGSGYFYFQFGEAADWLDRTVDTATVSGRGVKEWIDEFLRLKKLNEQIMQPAKKARPEAPPNTSPRGRSRPRAARRPTPARPEE